MNVEGLALLHISHSWWFSTARPKSSAHLSHDSLISLASPSGRFWRSRILCYPRTPLSQMLVNQPTSPRRLFKFLYMKSCSSTRNSLSYFPQKLRNIDCGTISSLNATSPAICLFCRAWQWNMLCARCVTVRFDHLHPFILRRIAVLSVRFQARPHFTFVSHEIYSYPTLYTVALVGYLLFSFPRRDIEASIEVFLSPAVSGGPTR